MKNVNIDTLKSASKFAAEKNISRQFVYQLIEKQEIDYTKIDGVMFIVMNDKAKNYTKLK